MSFLSSIITPKIGMKLIKKKVDAFTGFDVEQFDIILNRIDKTVTFKIYSRGDAKKYKLIPFKDTIGLYESINSMTDKHLSINSMTDKHLLEQKEENIKSIELLVIEYNELTDLFVKIYCHDTANKKQIKTFQL